MKCLGLQDCDGWLSNFGYGTTESINEKLRNIQKWTAFVVPKTPTGQISLCHTIIDHILPDSEEMLLYLRDWPLYKKGEMAIWNQIRLSYGTDGDLISVPGHLLTKQDRDSGLCAGLCSLIMLSGWEGFLALSTKSGIVFGDAWFELFSDRPEVKTCFKNTIEDFKLQSFRGYD